MTHSLIVGFGIAGLTFAEQLIRNKKDFLIIDDNKLGASHISSGIYNPTILKRYSITWKGHEFLKYSKTFYRRLERRINSRVNYSNQINRIFSKESELLSESVSLLSLTSSTSPPCFNIGIFSG